MKDDFVDRILDTLLVYVLSLMSGFLTFLVLAGMYAILSHFIN